MDKRFTDSDTKGLELLVPQLMIAQSMALETDYSDMPESMTECFAKCNRQTLFLKKGARNCKTLQPKIMVMKMKRLRTCPGV